MIVMIKKIGPVGYRLLPIEGSYLWGFAVLLFVGAVETSVTNYFGIKFDAFDAFEASCLLFKCC